MNTYETYRVFVENALNNALSRMDCGTPTLGESMRYSLLAGGKRLRPVLFCAMLDALGGDYTKEENLITAIESIHTYSLIHDDLPAMDNDDFRRGKPSNHKVFGEANAILAGDGLLSYAFELLLEECRRGESHVNAALTLAKAAGVSGMVAGQSDDLYYSGNATEAGESVLKRIHENKTAKLIAAPLVMAANLTKRCEAEVLAFGTALGLLFQITDDILDEIGDEKEVGKTLGKDKAEEKLTAVNLFGLNKSRQIADGYADECNRHLTAIDADTRFFEELVQKVRTRSK